jgi:hypothetical protein
MSSERRTLDVVQQHEGKRHHRSSLRAEGEAIQDGRVHLDCFVACAPRNDGRVSRALHRVRETAVS